VDGIAASSRNVRSGYFPMSRPLTLVTRSLPDGITKDFLEFATSSQVTALVREYGFVPYLD
jgi:phosphate transport system substrate-binding protein